MGETEEWAHRGRYNFRAAAARERMVAQFFKNPFARAAQKIIRLELQPQSELADAVSAAIGTAGAGDPAEGNTGDVRAGVI